MVGFVVVKLLIVFLPLELFVHLLIEPGLFQKFSVCQPFKMRKLFWLSLFLGHVHLEVLVLVIGIIFEGHPLVDRGVKLIAKVRVVH